MQENPGVRTIAFPKLKAIGGWYDINDNNALESVETPALESVGGIYCVVRGCLL